MAAALLNRILAETLSPFYMKRLLKLLWAGVLLSAVVGAHAAWPDRPITLVVPFPPGGGTDVVGRIIAKELGQRLGVAVVVENRPGASGNIGARFVAKARPDGYTLLVATTAQSISAALYRQAGYDLVNDLESVSTINEGPLVLITRPSLKISSVKDLIALARRSPGKLTYATPGYGTSAHMAAEVLSLATGIKMLHVPYQGAAPVLTDLMGGQVDLTFDLLTTARQHVLEGKVHRVGMTTRERSPLAPDWQTLSEQSPENLGNFHETAWNVLMAPKGTPAAVVQGINVQMKALLASDAVKEKLMDLGSIPLWKNLENTRSFVIEDVKKWKKVVHDAGIEKI